MKSPFPGMDPYLEDPAFWSDFHIEIIVALRSEIKRVLPPNYEARLGERIALVESGPGDTRTNQPEFAVLQRDASTGRAKPSSGGLVIEPVSLPLFADEEIREVWIEVCRRPNRQLVTVVEVLSPTNKMGAGRWEYRAKRRALARQSVHLVEIDLLAGGDRVISSPAMPVGDYYAFVSRHERRPHGDVYGWSVRQELPPLPIPLAAPDPNVYVDLQSAFLTAFENGDYGALIDYSRPPQAPLAEADRHWAASRETTP